MAIPQIEKILTLQDIVVPSSDASSQPILTFGNMVVDALPALIVHIRQTIALCAKDQAGITLSAILGAIAQDRHKSPQEHHKMVQLHVHTDACTRLSGQEIPDCSTRARQLHKGSGGLAMPRYFQSFKVYGEVADLLLLERPERRLMIDISLEPALHEPGRNPYPHRTTFCLTDPTQMERFLSEFSIGDAIDAEGTFTQTDYIPHRTTCIDTTFLLLDFRRLADSEQLIPAPAEFAKDALRRMRLH